MPEIEVVVRPTGGAYVDGVRMSLSWYIIPNSVDLANEVILGEKLE